MNARSLQELLIAPAPPERRGDVARFLFSPRAGCRRTWEGHAAPRDMESPSALFEARRGDRTVGAVWGRSWPDGVAQVVPPRIAQGESDDTAHWLLRKLNEHLSASEVRVAFAYVPSDDPQSLRPFIGNGYQPVGKLLVLACATDMGGHTPAGDGLLFRRYLPACQQRLRDLVKRTEEGSLDFPELAGLFRAGDVLARFARAGDSSTEHWWFVRSADRDVGCLLLAEHGRRVQFELAYMGLVPEARGRGWGHQMVAYAVRAAYENGNRQIVLGVDAANDPAIAVYARAGFVEHHRRSVVAKTFGPLEADSGLKRLWRKTGFPPQGHRSGVNGSVAQRRGAAAAQRCAPSVHPAATARRD